MQIRPGHHNRSRPHRRRLHVQVRPRVDMKTDTGGSDRAGAVAPAAWSRHRQGAGGPGVEVRHGSWPPAAWVSMTPAAAHGVPSRTAGGGAHSRMISIASWASSKK